MNRLTTVAGAVALATFTTFAVAADPIKIGGGGQGGESGQRNSASNSGQTVHRQSPIMML